MFENETLKERSIDVLARTLWAEARGEGEEGMKAVACVVLNRVAVADQYNGRYWWGNDIQSVCLKPWQFSCWNKNDPNLKKLLHVSMDDRSFVLALDIAKKAYEKQLKDFTNEATHYHTKYIIPHWAKNQKPSAIIGKHIFYKLEG